MNIFQNKSFLIYKLNPLNGSQYQLAFLKLSVFMHLWATDFWVYTIGHRMPFQHFYSLSPLVIMSNHECQVFHPWGGDLLKLAMPNTHIFHFQTYATHFGRCPLLPSLPSNTKNSVDQPCPHDIPLNTKHSVDKPCTHDIPSNTKHSVEFYLVLTPMSCDVLVHNEMQSCHFLFIPCYIYSESYMCMPTHA